jgi:hypothetical protein
MSKKKKNSTYTFSYNQATNIVTKTDVDTGNSWDYLSRPRPGKLVCATRNGATVDKLQAAGNNVRVKHLRWAVYLGQSYSGPFARLIVVPSTFRKDPNYYFSPKGGYTHVVIKRANGEYVCVSSECSQEDPFSYNMGVATALDRLTREELEMLGV